MKRYLKVILCSILACLVIAGSAIGTSAACGRKVVYYVGNDPYCSSDPACGSDKCPQDCGSLRDLLKRLGCKEESCSQLYALLNRCGKSANDCGSACTEAPECDGGSCENITELPEPTEPATVPVQEPTAVETEAPTEAETEAPAPQPVQEPSQAPAVQPTESPAYAVNQYEKEVVALINQIRAEHGLNSLKLNTELSRVARIKSQDMHDKGYFSHTSPTYGSPFDMMTAFGIRYRTAGENIAMGYRTPQSVVDGWMNSEGHRRNILDPNFTEIGMGYVESGHYWTQMFIGK